MRDALLGAEPHSDGLETRGRKEQKDKASRDGASVAVPLHPSAAMSDGRGCILTQG